MEAAGIIAEYNPFHMGHAYHIEQTKKICKAKYIIAVMSGSFVQRGEPAMFDKWIRTKAALSSGVDLVIELPSIFSAASAKDFALAGVGLLESLGLVEALSFGSEAGEVLPLRRLAGCLDNESEEFSLLLKEKLSLGYSYAQAVPLALSESGEPDARLFYGSNNILAIEYIRALNKLNSAITPITIKRSGAKFNSNFFSEELPSASAIRNEIALRLGGRRDDKTSIKNKLGKTFEPMRPGIFSGYSSEAVQKKASGFNEILEACQADRSIGAIWKYMPKAAGAIFSGAISEGAAPVLLESFAPELFYRIRISKKEELFGFAHVSEGLENKLKNIPCNMSSALEELTTKRYPRTKMQRMLLHILLGTTKAELEEARKTLCPYIRVLGFRRDAEPLLSRLTEKASLPVIINIKNANKVLDVYGMEFLQREILAQDIYSLGVPYPEKLTMGRDYTEKLVIL